MKVVGAFVGGAVVAGLVGVAILYFADLEVVSEDGATAEDSRISVPNVLGQSTLDAETEIRNAGLEAESDYYEQSRFWRGFNPIGETVIGTQNPDPGTEVEPDSTVGLGIK